MEVVTTSINAIFHEASTVNLSHLCHPDITNNDSPNSVHNKIRSTVKLTNLLRRNESTVGTQNPRYGFYGGPEKLRDMLADELESVDDSLRNRLLSKNAKAKVASPKFRKAINQRRIHQARFICPFEHCNDDFTRKVNLDNHLKAHCGVTDHICDLCNKAFTTFPVLKRHIKSCQRKPCNLDFDDGGQQEMRDMLPIFSELESVSNGNLRRNLDGRWKAHCAVTDLLCHKCEMSFLTLPVLESHIKTCKWEQTNLASPEPESVDDSLRNKFFSKKPKVTSAKAPEASDCNDDFTWRVNRDNNLRPGAHHGITNFICDICDKSFTTLPVLKRHINTCKRKQNIGNEHPGDAASFLEAPHIESTPSFRSDSRLKNWLDTLDTAWR